MPLIPDGATAEEVLAIVDGTDWRALFASEIVMNHVSSIRAHAKRSPGAFPGAWKLVSLHEVMES